MQKESSSFVTSDIGVSAFLVTLGHKLTSTRPQGNFTAFVFPASASNDAEKFFNGGVVPGNELLVNYRELRRVIVSKNREQKGKYATYNGNNNG